jgi:hypothetical protein
VAFLLIIGTALLAVDPQPPVPAPAAGDADTSVAVALAEYNARRAGMPDTADAHWRLALWCEQKGLKAEATVELLAVTRLDPHREPAWKKLGYEKLNGRWMSTEEVKAARAEAEAQRKADARWRPLLVKWKTWLGQDARRAEAEAALGGVDDPRAVPAIWRVFARGGPADQERSIDMLGRIEGDRPSRALAGLAIYGKNDIVRRAAIATLLRRPRDDSLMAWIGLLREPSRYEVRQVAGPGSPGMLFVEGERFHVRRFYTPPSVEQTQDLFLSPETGRPVLPLQFSSSTPGPPPGSRCVGRTGNLDLYVFDYHWALPKPVKTTPDPSRAYQQFERSELQGQSNGDFELGEALKMAAGAQSQLEHDVAVVEAANGAVRETNARLAEALRRVSGQDFGTDREAWLKWWMSRRGYSYIPPEKQPTTTVDVQVALPYVPASGPPVLTPGGGGGGGRGWCLIWDHEKGQKPNIGSCFSGGTLVLTPGGPRAIETLGAGDQVLTGDGKGGTSSVSTIGAVHQSWAGSTLALVLDKETIVTTAGHPFWTPGQGWIRAGDLAPGDLVLAASGPARLEAIERRAGRPVWNLRLDHCSTFLVGRLGLLVHDVSPIAETPHLVSPDLPDPVPLVDDQTANVNLVAGFEAIVRERVVDDSGVEPAVVHALDPDARRRTGRQDRGGENDLAAQMLPLKPLLAQGAGKLLDRRFRDTLEAARFAISSGLLALTGQSAEGQSGQRAENMPSVHGRGLIHSPIVRTTRNRARPLIMRS